MKRAYIISAFILAATCSASAVCNAEIKAGTTKNYLPITIKDTVMVTYPYSDPNPIPETGLIYPYWHFSGFTNQKQEKTWKMVVLENDYLRVKIFPEIGGKVWSVFDKTAGKEMFYDNDVVKFREIAMRGPWTSGGIEFNYGIIGHAPSCASTVDWDIRHNADGSVSCFIGNFEMLSRSHWVVEIRLPKDAVMLETCSKWHNGSSEYQPYYSWANSAVKATDDLVLVYPSNDAIFHDGSVLKYPLDEQGRDISVYRNQNYGTNKSYHMVGSHKPFFGCYYSTEDWGVLHYSLRDEKVGRKYFGWAQSREGEIWVNHLTDTRTQYIEMQSGRLFNQNNVESSEISPYRQPLFSPMGSEEWIDYWIPYRGIGPADNVCLDSVTSVSTDGTNSTASIYPLVRQRGSLQILDSKGNVLLQQECNLCPAQPLTFKVKGSPAKVQLSGKTIWSSEDQRTSRPLSRNPQFNPESASAQLLLARDYSGMRMYALADSVLDVLLSREPDNIDALALKSGLLLRKAEYEQALEYSDKALSIDQYHPDAGYFGGLAAAQLGRYADAFDRLEVSCISNSPIRSAAYTELARLYFRQGDPDLAMAYADKAYRYNVENLTALRILSISSGRDKEMSLMYSNRIRKINPLDHFPDAEEMIARRLSRKEFAKSFKEEAYWEDYLELALFYHSLGLDLDALTILEVLPQKNALTELWAAYIKGDKTLIPAAEKAGLELVFPFRRESVKALQWAVDNGGKWQSRYLLAALKDFLSDTSAAALLMGCNGNAAAEEADYAPYYAYRYKFSGDGKDLEKAISQNPEEWRYHKMLARHLIENGQAAQAVELLERFYAEHPDNLPIGDALLDAYMAADMFDKAEQLVDVIEYLPYEDLISSREKYRIIKQHLAEEAIAKGDFERAANLIEESLLWPERLGSGKPYDDMIDTSAADSLRQVISAAGVLFQNKGVSEQDFRIPAVCINGNGDIVSFADRRYSERGADIGAGEIDIQSRISKDGGKTWDNSPQSGRTVVDGIGGQGFDCAHGDAAVVCDRSTGTILLMCASGSVGYPDGGCRVGRYYSSDGGLTFSGGEMTAAGGLPAELETDRKFFSSGRICQSRIIKKGSHYRIYAGVPCSRGGQVLYSDNLGKSWECLGAAVEGADECKVEELPDGSVLLSSRIRGGQPGRMFTVFSYTGKGFKDGAWSHSIVSSDITAAACNGEILMVQEKKGSWILLQSVARSNKRENVSIYWKRLSKKDNFRNPDFYNEWDGCMQVCSGSSCYSTMVADGKGNIAFLWEQNNILRDWIESYNIMFKSIPLADIVNCKK